MPLYISEYGGKSYLEKGNGAWGYNKDSLTQQQFVEKYALLTETIMDSGAIGMYYTQLTDVEQEQNGLYYSRNEKFDSEIMEKIKNINCHKAKVEE